MKPIVDTIQRQRQRGQASGPLAFAITELDLRQALQELTYLLQHGNHVETIHAATRLRYVWDDPDASKRELIVAGLERRFDDDNIEEW